jgi:CPA1 family monovalent cation:H+ antiporter
LSLVLYAAAVTAAVTGVFDPGRWPLYLVAAALGSVVIGLVVGRAAVEGWRRVKDTELQSVISLLLPFVAYVPAQRLGTSGVLEVVTAGVYVNRFTPLVLTPQSRLRLIGFWETFVFVANALLFLLVGLQLHDVAAQVFRHDPWPNVVGYTVAINVVVLGVRFAWIVGTEYLPLIGGSSEHAVPDWKHAVIASWSGLRGAVSLAAALAIPLTVASGAPFPNRDLIIFLTFSVIVVTLVGGGLTLPAVISALHVEDSDSEESADLKRAWAGVSAAALARIDALERDKEVDHDFAQTLRRRFETFLETSVDATGPKREKAESRASAEREVIDAARQALIALRAQGEIDNAVLRRVQFALDIAHTRGSAPGKNR